jgi:hypothetical protein
VTAYILKCSNFAVFAQDYKESQPGHIKGVIISDLLESTLMTDEKPSLRLLDEEKQKAVLDSHRAEESTLLKLEQLVRRFDWRLNKCSPLCIICTARMCSLRGIQEIEELSGWSCEDQDNRTDGSKNGE